MSPTLSALEVLARLLAAITLGGLIGYERERREQPAGLRTHLLVSLASAAFTLVSLQAVFYQHWGPATGGQILQFESGRIASNIVVGIGFLGGGAILHAGMTIKGLTTAASLWMCAAVGMAAGAGMVYLAALSTGLCLFALVVLKLAVEDPEAKVLRVSLSIDLRGAFVSRTELAELLRPIGGEVVRAGYTRDLANDRTRVVVDVRLPDHNAEEPLRRCLETLPGLQRVRVRRAG